MTVIQIRQQRAKAQDHLREAQWQLANSLVNRAQGEWSAGNVGVAERLLDACPPERRGWEWDYCEKLCHLEQLTLRGHTRSVVALSFNRDGSRLVSAAREIASGESGDELRLWDGSSGRAIFSLRSDHVNCVAYSPAGEFWAYDNNEGDVVLADAATDNSNPDLPEDDSWVASVGCSIQRRRPVARRGDRG